MADGSAWLAGRARWSGAVIARRLGFGFATVMTALAITGCGQSVSTELPDLAVKNATAAGGKPPLTATEQKQAIDGMIAKRNALDQGQANQSQSK